MLTLFFATAEQLFVEVKKSVKVCQCIYVSNHIEFLSFLWVLVFGLVDASSKAGLIRLEMIWMAANDNQPNHASTIPFAILFNN